MNATVSMVGSVAFIVANLEASRYTILSREAGVVWEQNKTSSASARLATQRYTKEIPTYRTLLEVICPRSMTDGMSNR